MRSNFSFLLLAVICAGCQNDGGSLAKDREQSPGIDSQALVTQPGRETAAQPPTALTKENQALTASAGGFTATIVQAPKATLPSFTDAWGYYGASEPYLVVTLKIVGPGGEWHVWRSAYSDLANVHNIEWIEAGSKPVLLIEGGDAGESFDCKLYFEKGELVKRSVAHGEFRDQVIESTTYNNEPIGEDPEW